jgi:hypothetical protein
MLKKNYSYKTNYLDNILNLDFFFLVYYFNFSKKEFIELKKYCLENSISIRHVKNNIGKKTLIKSKYSNLSNLFSGSILVIYGDFTNFKKVLLFLLKHPKITLIFGKYLFNFYSSQKISIFLKESNLNQNIKLVQGLNKKISSNITQNLYFKLFKIKNILNIK